MQDNDIEIYSTHKEGKSVIGERFIKSSKNNIYKCKTSASKNVYIDNLDDIDDKYNNTYSITKMKPVDVKPSTDVDYNVEKNDKDPKFKVGNYVRTSKHRNIFAKDYTPN